MQIRTNNEKEFEQIFAIFKLFGIDEEHIRTLIDTYSYSRLPKEGKEWRRNKQLCGKSFLTKKKGTITISKFLLQRNGKYYLVTVETNGETKAKKIPVRSLLERSYEEIKSFVKKVFKREKSFF